MTEPDLRPPGQRAHASRANGGTTKWLLLVLAIAAVAYAGWWAREHWAERQRAQAAAAVPAAAPPLSSQPAPAAEPAPAIAEPATPAVPATVDAPLHPLAPDGATALAADDTGALDTLVREWLGQAAAQWVALPGLAHHVVATIDNLPRSHAAPRLWPLYPVGGQLQLSPAAADGSATLVDGNFARYDTVVGWVTGLDAARWAAIYRQAYPVLQHTYEQLGYPGRYFNDRVVEVIDHLLQTPNIHAPLAVQRVRVQAPSSPAPQQPWLYYEFADPRLQALSAGQKILLRVGPEHRQRLFAQLRALRQQIAP